MKYINLLNDIETVLNDGNHSFLSYNSLIEEALKLVIRVKNENKPINVVKENNYLANRLKDILLSYLDEDELVSFLPEESLRAEEIASSFENRAERLNSLYKLITNNKTKIVVTSPYGFIRHLPTKEELKEKLITISKDDVCDKQELIEKLIKLGYEKTNHVETPMCFASRGYIVDVYSINYDKPIRIEFFDDVIDSIRFFDINSQRTLEKIDEATICFAKDVFFNDEEKQYLKDNIEILSGEMELNMEYIMNDIYRQAHYFYYAYFEKSHLKDYLDNHYLYISDEDKIMSHLKMLSNETISYIQEMHEEKKLPLRFFVYSDFHLECAKEKIITGEPFKQASKINEIDLPYGSIDYVLSVLKNDASKYKLIVLNDKQSKEVIDSLIKQAIPYTMYTS